MADRWTTSRSARGLTTRERDVVRVVTRALLPSFPPLRPDAATRVQDDVTGFLIALIGRMPMTLQLPYRAALVAFDGVPVLRYRRPFRRLDGSTQEAWLRLWDERGGMATRSFVKVLRSCALFAFFDHPLVAAELDAAARPGAAA